MVAVTEWIPEVAPEVPAAPNSMINKSVVETCRDFCRRNRAWPVVLPSIDVVAAQEADIAFVESGPDTITTVAGDFATDGFAAAQVIYTTSDYNPGPYTLAGATNTTITLDAAANLVAEDAAAQTVSVRGYEIASALGDVASIARAFFDNELMEPISEMFLYELAPDWAKVDIEFPTKYFMSHDRMLHLVYMPNTSKEEALRVTANLMPARTATTVEDFLYDDYLECIKYGAIARCLMIGQMGDPQKAQNFYSLYERMRANAFDKLRNGYTKAGAGGVSG